jgi:uncharacterized membrane protein
LKILGYDDKKAIVTTIILVIAALIVDTISLKVYDLFIKDPTSSLTTFVFIIIAAIYCMGQYIILKFVKVGSKEIRALKVLHFNILYNSVKIIQYILAAILVYVVLQVALTSQYTTAFISIATTISCILACSMLVILIQRFFSWFKTNKDYVVFLYGLSAAVLAISTVILFIFVDIVLSSTKEDTIMPKVGGTSLFLVPGTINDFLNSSFIISSLLSFLLTWIATSMLLRHYSKKIGRLRYWLVVIIPLVYFTSQFFSLSFNLFVPLLRSDAVFYGIILTFIFTFSKLVGAIFFGVAFWVAARSIRPDSIVRKYMIMSAYGLIFLFISNQANGIIVTSYPPFGLATISFIGLASFLLLVGIYSAAISFSEDAKLRQTIRKFAIKESKLLDSIGSAEMEQEIIKKVDTMAKEQSDIMKEQTGIMPSMNENDVKDYLEQVINEIKKKSK